MGCIAYNVMKFSPKTDKAANWMQLATGAIVTVLFGIGARAVWTDNGLADMIRQIGWAGGDAEYLPSSVWYSHVLVSVAFIGQLIVFGLMPLLKGVSKTLFATAEDDNNIPLAPRTKKEKSAKVKKEKPAKPANGQPAQPPAPTRVAVQPPAPAPATAPTPATPVSATPPKAAPTPRAPKPK